MVNEGNYQLLLVVYYKCILLLLYIERNLQKILTFRHDTYSSDKENHKNITS